MKQARHRETNATSSPLYVRAKQNIKNYLCLAALLQIPFIFLSMVGFKYLTNG